MLEDSWKSVKIRGCKSVVPMKKQILLIIFLVFILSAAAAGSTYGAKRAVSLKTLQQKLEIFDKTGAVPDGITRLGGLNTVEGYIIDAANKDIILVGSVIPGAPLLYLEDLAVALRNSWYEYAELRGKTNYYANPGCSIDPDPAVIQRLFALGKKNREDPSGITEEEYIVEWERIGKSPQAVRVLGIPFDTHFARVMVKADYDMKSLVNGSDNPDIPGFSSLMDMTMEEAKNAIQKGEAAFSGFSLNRFWFFPGKNLYREEDNAVMIEKCPVILLTEEQYLNKGKIAGYGGGSPLALKFTEAFSEKYSEIAARRPICVELENLFRFVAIAKVMKYMSAQEKSGLDLGYFLKQYSIPKTPVDRTLPGRTNVKKYESRIDLQDGYQTYRLWLPSCGGVGIEIEISKSNFIRSKAVKSAPAVKTGSVSKTGKSVSVHPDDHRGETSSRFNAGRAAPAAAPGKPEQIQDKVLKTRPAANTLYWDF